MGLKVDQIYESYECVVKNKFEKKKGNQTWTKCESHSLIEALIKGQKKRFSLIFIKLDRPYLEKNYKKKMIKRNYFFPSLKQSQKHYVLLSFKIKGQKWEYLQIFNFEHSIWIQFINFLEN